MKRLFTVAAAIVPLAAISSTIGFAGLAQAAPLALHDRAAADPSVTLVWQRCGHGFHRGNTAWKDKTGAWHGPCVANPSKGAGPSGTTAEQLNQQEVARLQTGAPIPQPYPGPPLGGHGGHAQ